MPAVNPQPHAASTPSRKLVRSLLGTGLTAAVVAIAIALPDQAAAAPSPQDKLKTVTADLKEAKSDLGDLKDRRTDANRDADTAQSQLDQAPDSVAEAVAAVDDAASPIDRLSVLSGYGSTRTAQLTEAVDTRADATELAKRLSGDIDDLEEKVDDLTDKRDKLKNEIAAEAEPKSTDTADSGGHSGGGGGDSAAVSSDGSGAVAFAKAQLGDAYVFGATGPDTWDCSSLTQAAWAAAGQSIGRDTYAQWGGMTHIDRSELRAGDLVFYGSQSHVAMYVGGGKVIHAPQPGEVVKYSPIDMMGIDGYARP